MSNADEITTKAIWVFLVVIVIGFYLLKRDDDEYYD
jgi:hypothetical protein